MAPGKSQGKSWCPGFCQVFARWNVGRLSTRHLPGEKPGPQGGRPFPGPAGPMSREIGQQFLAASQSAKICDYVLTSMEVIFPTEHSVLCNLGFSHVSRIPPRNQQNTRQTPWRLPGVCLVPRCFSSWCTCIPPGFPLGKRLAFAW